MQPFEQLPSQVSLQVPSQVAAHPEPHPEHPEQLPLQATPEQLEHPKQVPPQPPYAQDLTEHCPVHPGAQAPTQPDVHFEQAIMSPPLHKILVLIH